MLYKTIVLGLLEQNPELHEQLRRDGKLPSALNLFSMELKKIHEAWIDHLSLQSPASELSQISSEAMEFALKEFQDHFRSGLQADGNTPLSLDAAMAYIRRHTPPA